MKIYFVKDYEELSQKAFEIIESVILDKEYPVISLNTGGTPRQLFKNFVKAIQNDLDITRTTLLTLDEYVGPSDAVYSVQRYFKENLTDQIEDKFYHIDLIHGDANNQDEEIKRYQKILQKYPRDIQLLGLGTNGHIGANEPGTPFNSTMFVSKHTKETIESTKKEYKLSDEETPNEMFTLGFQEILQAKNILLLVSGRHKAKAVKTFLEDNISENCPVSYLRNYDNVTVIIDEDAASLLDLEK